MKKLVSTILLFGMLASMAVPVSAADEIGGLAAPGAAELVFLADDIGFSIDDAVIVDFEDPSSSGLEGTGTGEDGTEDGTDAPTTTEEGDEEGEPDEDPEDEKGEIGGEEGDDEGDDKSDLLDEVDLLDELDESERAGAVMRAPVSAQVSAQASAPMAVAGPRYTGIEGFVERLYSSVLGREAYDEEVRGYAAELRSGQLTAAQILLSFFGSAEFANRGLTNEEYVAVMYKVVLDREAWPEEIRGYSKELAAGYPRRALIQNFCYSLEFGKLAAGYGLEVGRLEYSYEMDRNPQMAMFVYRTYTLVLGRTKVWDEEIEGRVREMVNGDITAGQLALTCYMSPEFNNRRLSNEDFVASLYRTLLDREPWPEEISGWSKQLEQGASNNYMFQQFVYSREFANVCDRYGLTVGSFTIPDVVGPGPQRGIDVSAHQKDIDWNQVANAGYTFAIIRATTYQKINGVSVPVIDPYFLQNVRGAWNAGLKIGVYCFTYSNTVGGVNKELQALFSALQQAENEGIRFALPIFWDVEDSENQWVQSLDRNALTDLTKYALSQIESRGYYAGLYTYKSMVENRLNMDQLSSYDFWLAHYTTQTNYGGSYTIWQYSSKGSVPGIAGNVDMNYLYIDYDSRIKNKGYNHW